MALLYAMNPAIPLRHGVERLAAIVDKYGWDEALRIEEVYSLLERLDKHLGE